MDRNRQAPGAKRQAVWVGAPALAVGKGKREV